MKDTVHEHHRTDLAWLDDTESVSAQLAARLDQPDRTRFDLALRRSLANWAYFVPASAVVIWLTGAVWDLGLLVAVLLAVVLAVPFLHAVVSLAVSVTQLPRRTLRAAGHTGYGWYLLTIVIAVADTTVYGGCLYLLGRATYWWGPLW